MFDSIQSLNEKWIDEAIRLAQMAYEDDEIPVGAIVVQNNKVIGRGYNQTEKLNDPTAHAEILAITSAANTKADWRLDDCVLYVTKEPCAMCAGAVVNSRIQKVVFGCYDDKKGYCGSKSDICSDSKNNMTIRGGVKEDICLSLIQDFFLNKRKS